MDAAARRGLAPLTLGFPGRRRKKRDVTDTRRRCEGAEAERYANLVGDGERRRPRQGNRQAGCRHRQAGGCTARSEREPCAIRCPRVDFDRRNGCRVEP